MDATNWHKPSAILSLSRANLVAMGVSSETITALTDSQMQELALALQSRYLQYGGGFDRLVLRFLGELFTAEQQEEHGV